MTKEGLKRCFDTAGGWGKTGDTGELLAVGGALSPFELAAVVSKESCRAGEAGGEVLLLLEEVTIVFLLLSRIGTG